MPYDLRYWILLPLRRPGTQMIDLHPGGCFNCLVYRLFEARCEREMGHLPMGERAILFIAKKCLKFRSAPLKNLSLYASYVV